MKKYLLVLGMVTCLLGATACGNSNEVKEATISTEEATQVAVAYIDLVEGLQGVDIENNADAIEQYYGVDAKTISEAVDNYGTALEDLGTYQGIEKVSFTEDEKEIVINATVIGSEVRPDGAPRTAEVLITLELPKGTLSSMLTNVNYTFGELMTTAGLNTILGICTVFMVLVILMALISCFKFINKAEQSIADKKANKANAASTSVDKAVAQITENEEAFDDTELIAVIAAAIAASEGAASTDGYVVRSIRRR